MANLFGKFLFIDEHLINSKETSMDMVVCKVYMAKGLVPSI